MTISTMPSTATTIINEQNTNQTTITPTLGNQRIADTQNRLQEDVNTSIVAKDRNTAAFSHRLLKQMNDESAPLRVNVNIRVLPKSKPTKSTGKREDPRK